ncbi:FHA domain-containing protein, partial [uncultured Lamprocystis sp.]|uniref:FHA domain-containing protein n=1 Tax=uncultured Lamprocystis sp. TaxID=543132 RepID=UPI0025DDD551
PNDRRPGCWGSFLTPTYGLTDLNSANGTFVNQVRILSEQRLAVGDLIELGNSRVELRDID